MKIENRFLKYISFDTQSDPYSKSTPSTSKQKDLAEFLVEEMKILGLQNVYMSEYGVVYGTIPSNNQHRGDVIGFIAHMDTSHSASGRNIHPQIIRNYDGRTIDLNTHMFLDPLEFPELNQVINHDIITTDGTTLLGGDDKAGIAIIMSMAEYLYKHPNFLHNDIQIAFTPDEEIGKGVEHFDIERFNADYAYTIDGGNISDICYENFNAYAINVYITGKSVHPGSAKNKMINALEVGMQFNQLLPQHQKPEYTEDYDGFHHLEHMEGSCEKATLEYIVRDHDFVLLQDKMNDFKRIQSYLNNKYGYQLIELQMTEQYLNMGELIQKKPHIIEQVKTAMEDIRLTPQCIPMRGGTDGAMLSYKGLLCPNLGTGDFNCHGPYEFVSITMMKKGVELLLRLIRNNIKERL